MPTEVFSVFILEYSDSEIYIPRSHCSVLVPRADYEGKIVYSFVVGHILCFSCVRSLQYV